MALQTRDTAHTRTVAICHMVSDEFCGKKC